MTITQMNVSLFGICVHTALSAELYGHKEVDGRSWKDVADEVLVYKKILSADEVLLLNNTPIGQDVEGVPYNFDGTEEIESIICIDYSNSSSDVTRFSEFQDSTWDSCDTAYELNGIIEHKIIWHYDGNDWRNETELYYNHDVETNVTTIMSLFNTVHFHSCKDI